MCYFKRWLMILVSVWLCSYGLYATQLSILTDSSQSKIYINKQLKATENLVNYNIEPGSYLVEVYEDDVLVFSELVALDQKNKTISVNVTGVNLPTQFEDARLKEQQANYALGKKSRFGVGLSLHYASISGLMMSYDTAKTGHQGVFWVTNFKDNAISQVGYRHVRYFKNKLIKNGIVRPYIGLGAGYYYRKTQSYKTDATILEVPFGFQMSFMRPSHKRLANKQRFSSADLLFMLYFWPLAVAKKAFEYVGATNDLYMYLETGLLNTNVNSNDPNAFKNYTGLKIGTGFIYYL